jgi:hypothetical protein
VSESTASMLSRLDAMESEFTDMIDSLRTGANRLDADLRLLEGNLAEVGETIVPRPRFELEPDPEPPAVEVPAEEPSAEAAEPETAVVETEVEAIGAFENGAGATESEGALASAPEGYDVADGDVASQAEGADDAEGARLIALNMALNGTPREETAKYLSENFQLSDRDGLLDEVYASVEG